MSLANREVATRWFDAINRHDLEGVGELVAADATWRVPVSAEPLHGREAVQQLVGGFISAFSDLRIEIQEQTAEDDRVVSRVVASGTNDGELLGIPPTGKRVSWDVIHHQTVRDGELAQDFVVFDRLALMEQLGAIPQPAQTAG